MQSLHFVLEPGAQCCAYDLPLRMPQVSGIIDPEPFRSRARGEGLALAEAFAPSGGVRSLQCDPDRHVALFGLAGPLLTFVISGGLEVETANRGRLQLGPGDLFLSCGEDLEKFFTTAGDCRLLQVLVPADWPGDRARPAHTATQAIRSGPASNVQRMFKGADDKSYFRPFDNLFAPPGQWSEVTPLIGLRFIGMAADTIIDWHPEIVNNLVIVLSGALELETGGGEGALEVFYEGDICLAEDRTGQGHIDRMHGHVQVAILIVEDADLWD